MAIKQLPNKEYTFTIEVKGSGTGQIYAGTFTYKRATLRTKSEISKTKILLDGGLDLDSDMDFIHKILSNLRHTIVKFPNWWADLDYGYEIDEADVNVLFDIYKECNEFEKSWFDQVWAPKAEESKESEQEKPAAGTKKS